MAAIEVVVAVSDVLRAARCMLHADGRLMLAVDSRSLVSLGMVKMD